MHEPAGAQGRKTVWEKVYTSDQAALGKTEYDMVCAGCHGNDLSGRDGGGQGPELAGPAFRKKWDLQSVNQLYHRDQDAHAAQPARYAHRRRLPERRGLRPRVEQVPRRRQSARRQCGALASTFITQAETTKAAADSAAIATGALVQVIGCLQNSGDGWMLTQAAPPVRGGKPRHRRPNSWASWPQRRRAPQACAYFGIYSAPNEHKGHRMEAKGFLVKDPDGDRLNVVSLEMIAPACAPYTTLLDPRICSGI